MEGVKIRQICANALSKKGSKELLPYLETITSGWKYH